MIKVENIEVFGWEAAIRGMRNPMNSWNKSDSTWCYENQRNKSRCSQIVCDDCVKPFYEIGENDLKLMKSLVEAGGDHRKFLRMINVTMDITAPLYWWKEYDTYKVGTVANSCSTMHKIADKEFTLDDFSHEHLWDTARMELESTIKVLNNFRDAFNHPSAEGKYKKECWWQMIQLLPSSYNQRRTVQLNYEVLLKMYYARRNHKLTEWGEFCKIIESLPYFKEICLDE